MKNKRKRKSITEKCEKKSIISKSSKLQASIKSKDASSSSNEVYSILESSSRRKANKQTVLISSDEKSILLQSLKRSTQKKTKIHQKKKINTKSLFKYTIFGVLFTLFLCFYHYD